jgi:hypothetical protein
MTTRLTICRGRIVCAPSIFVGKRMLEQGRSRLAVASRVSRFVVGAHTMRPLQLLRNDVIGSTAARGVAVLRMTFLGALLSHRRVWA